METSHLKDINLLSSKIPSPIWKRYGHLRSVRRIAGLSLLMLMLLACGQEESGTSGYRADLLFPDDIPRLAGTTAIDCTAARIAVIDFHFIADGRQYGPRSFACEAHNALITDVPAGTGITVEVFADDADGNALLEGSEIIDIPKDQVATGGTIPMQRVLSEPVPDTNENVADFDGTWIIENNPNGCTLAGPEIYRSEIEQIDDHAKVTSTIESRPGLIIESPYCTISGDRLTCRSFDFTDREGWKHVYSLLYLELDGYSDRVTGNSNYIIYMPSGTPYCTGTAVLIGERELPAGDT